MHELLVVTHPESTHHVDDRVGGWFDSTLTARGETHARAIASALAARMRPGAALFSSDLRRTARTAELIAESSGVRPVFLRELREKSYGVAEGRSQSWLRDRFIPPPRDGERMDHDEGIDGAETRAEWARRVYAAMDRITADPAEQAVVVTHGGSAVMMIAHWIGMPVDSVGRVGFRLDPGSITRLVEDDYFHNRSVAVLGDVSHLPPRG